MAGVLGFEPRHGRIKICRLTTCRHPKRFLMKSEYRHFPRNWQASLQGRSQIFEIFFLCRDNSFEKS